MVCSTDYFLPQRRVRLFIVGVNIARAEIELNTAADSVCDMAVDTYFPAMKLETGDLATRIVE